MKRFAVILSIGVCAAFGLTGAASGAEPSVYGALPAVSEVRISPDGSSVAMLRSANDTMSVVFYDLADPEARPAGVQVGGGKARDLVWADDDHVLVLASQTGRMQLANGLEELEFFRWFSVSKSSLKPVVLFGNEGNYYITSAGALISTLPGTPDDALFARISIDQSTGYTDTRLGGDRSGASYDLFKADLRTGDTSVVEAGNRRTYDWLASRTGQPTARIDYEALKKEVILNIRDGGSWRSVKTYTDAPGASSDIAFYGEAPTDGRLVATVRGANGTRTVIAIDKSTGEHIETLFASPDYDVDHVVFDYARATATAVRYVGDMPHTVYFDAAEQKVQEQLEKALPGAAPVIVSKSADGTKMIVRAEYSDFPGQFYLFDRTRKSLSMIAAAYPKLDDKSAAKKEKFDYLSSDGLKIPGYLTVPSGAERKNMPLIVLPHGGPQGRDDMAFDWWSFFYAANGYLVYQPNFRGSDGYGAQFVSAGFGEWGGKMQDDITEGVKKLIADGIVDPERICIVGASYGGFAALSGATTTPDLYACAVSVNGVSNLPAMIGRSAKNSDLADDYWEVRLGSRFRDAEALRAASPAFNAEKAGAPILIIHGRDDTIVPFSHAIRMYEALKAAKKPVELVELKGEDHWLSRASSRTETLARSLEFIKRRIGG